MRFLFLVFAFLNLISLDANSQTIKGRVMSNNTAVPFANIVIEGINMGVSADEYGDYIIEDAPLGYNYLIVSSVGMLNKKIYKYVDSGINVIDIELVDLVYDLDQVVISGTKTFKRKTNSAVIVNVIDSKLLESINACNLAEGLNMQAGLRVENDCQTCNYTQLRMNGLAGGYSQILINGRSIFSPLNGLYGMEQIPVNMIDRIEVVRGGGSALYGSAAVGGIVNVITKLPTRNNYIIGYNFSRISSSSDDKVFYGNATVLSSNRSSGVTFFVNHRDRMWYDHNGDNFSELPLLNNNSFGANLFFVPSQGQKIELNIGSLNEYRYGGQMVDGAPHFAMQSEERVHDVLLGNIDYQFNFNDNSSLIAYLAAQNIDREHYTGIRPEIATYEDLEHLADPPYGVSLNNTRQAGLQVNHKVDRLFGDNVLTVGCEYISDDIMDEIISYNYLVDQQVVNLGSFFQSDWDLTEDLNLLSGIRFDKHSLLENMVFSPRFSLLYRFRKETQLRMSYSTGFRAPQAFDADMHIAFAGGGISRIILADDLNRERSKSLSMSVNYDRAHERYIYGFTVEGFYTRLDDAFFQEYFYEDEFGDVLVKRNGPGASVKGITIEFRANIMRKLQVESGLTLQNSIYDEGVVYSDSLNEKKEFLRTPGEYGYAVLTYNPSSDFSFAANLVYTGKMDLLHLAGAPGQDYDEFFVSPIFSDIGLKGTYVHDIDRRGVSVEYSLGVKNLTNSYQKEFDTLKNRDSNFIYGPHLPRSIYFGLVLKSL